MLSQSTMPLKIQHLIKQPYPFYYQGKALVWVSLVVFIVGFNFIYLFEPFNNDYAEHKMPFFLICAIHSLVPALLFIPFSVITRSFINTDNWTLGKEIIFFFIFLTVMGIGQFLIRDLIYDNPDNWSWRYLREEMSHGYLIGLLFLCIWLPYNFNRPYKKNVNKASLVSLLITKGATQTSEQHIPIVTGVKSDDFELDLNSFLYARSEGNYLEIYMYKNGIVEKAIKRITLTDFAGQVATIKHLFRSHRSYLVNLRKIEAVSGNAQGYKLSLVAAEDQIPVARNSISTFEKAFENF